MGLIIACVCSSTYCVSDQNLGARQQSIIEKKKKTHTSKLEYLNVELSVSNYCLLTYPSKVFLISRHLGYFLLSPGCIPLGLVPEVDLFQQLLQLLLPLTLLLCLLCLFILHHHTHIVRTHPHCLDTPTLSGHINIFRTHPHSQGTNENFMHLYIHVMPPPNLLDPCQLLHFYPHYLLLSFNSPFFFAHAQGKAIRQGRPLSQVSNPPLFSVFQFLRFKQEPLICRDKYTSSTSSLPI